MTAVVSLLKRQIAFCLLAFMVAPIGAATIPPKLGPQDLGTASTERRSQPLGVAENNTVAEVIPDSPGAMLTQTSSQSQQTPASQGAQTKQGNPPPPPVGTAAAPYEKPEGVPASRPAGAAIAPAKQRRTRSFAIRTALVVGAGVAIGVVIATSLSSSSRPN
jgi:hypothetical protein